MFNWTYWSIFKKQKNIEEDENEDADEAQVKININLEYNDIIIVNFRKIERKELLTLDRPPIVVEDENEEWKKKILYLSLY